VCRKHLDFLDHLGHTTLDLELPAALAPIAGPLLGSADLTQVGVSLLLAH
jgi:hypothetical protein